MPVACVHLYAKPVRPAKSRPLNVLARRGKNDYTFAPSLSRTGSVFLNLGIVPKVMEGDDFSQSRAGDVLLEISRSLLA
jgi:hypothetical protein